MPPSVLLQLAPHYATEFVAAIALLVLTGRAWNSGANPLLVRLAGHKRRYLIALGCLVAPMVLGWGVLRPLVGLRHSMLGQALWLGLSLLTGLFIGMMVGCVVAPKQREASFPMQVGCVVLTILILAPLCLVLIGGNFSPFSPVFHWFFELSVLFCAMLWLRKSEGTLPSSPDASQGSPALALIIGFFPSALSLMLIALAAVVPNMGNDATRAILIVASVLSVVCCFTGSILLFKRRTGLAIFGGVMFMLLNGFIAFFTGCLAAFTGASFH